MVMSGCPRADRYASMVAHGLARRRVTFVVTRHVPSPDPPGWVDGAPTSGIGQLCAFCGTREVAWVHPLASDLVTYRVYGKGHTLPNFWALCDRCEGNLRGGGRGRGG